MILTSALASRRRADDFWRGDPSEFTQLDTEMNECGVYGRRLGRTRLIERLLCGVEF